MVGFQFRNVPRRPSPSIIQRISWREQRLQFRDHLQLYAVFEAFPPLRLMRPMFQPDRQNCADRDIARFCAGFPNTVRDANQLTGDQMAVQMTKSQLIEKIAGETEVAKKAVKGVLETLATIGYKELKKSGVFLVPGFAKFVVIKKPATKARQGTNPFTGEAMTFKAKPARKIVRARPVKAAKDAV
jgi:DNA-binding protein HU-beta